jgi:cyclophilin family peptidyl-prolyl cis-trans isomerase
MTSLVTFLLFQRQGQIAPPPDARAHRIATPEDDASEAYDSELIRRVVATRLANVETVFGAISDGIDTITEIQRVPGLGKKVVQRAVTTLERNGRIVRAIPTSRSESHRIKLIHNHKGNP